MEISDDSRCFKDGGTFGEISNFIWRPYSKFGRILTTFQKTWMALKTQFVFVVFSTDIFPQMGHILKDCPNAGTKTCYKCGGIGHILKECPSRGWKVRDIYFFKDQFVDVLRCSYSKSGSQVVRVLIQLYCFRTVALMELGCRKSVGRSDNLFSLVSGGRFVQPCKISLMSAYTSSRGRSAFTCNPK